MQLKVDTIDKWEDVLAGVNKDQIPIDCVKKILFKLKGGKRKTINLSTLRKQGLELEEIEVVITRSMVELNKQIENMDFVIDVNSVADYIQPLTDQLLEKL
jgi:hypothetical protein